MTMVQLCGRAVPWRSAYRSTVVRVVLLITAGIMLTTLLLAPAHRAGQQQQLFSRQYLPSADVGAAAVAAAVSRHLQRVVRHGAETGRAIFSYLEQPEPCCRRLAPAAAGVSGPPLCEDAPLAPAAHSCLVYSFGVSANQSFERAMVARGCEVHAFDPIWPGAYGRQQSGAVLHRRALSGENGTSEAGWHRATFGETLRDLSHVDRTIDYLRMDVMGGEWAAIDAEEDTVLTQVRQLGMVAYFNDVAGLEDTSPRNYNYMLKWYYDTFIKLHELGFCLTSSRESDYPRRHRILGVTEEKATIWELMWVRR